MNDFYLMRKNLSRKKLRAILMLVAIFIAFLIFGVLASFQHGFNAGTGLGGTDSRLITVSKINFTQSLPVAHIARIAGVDGVETVAMANWFGGYYQEPSNLLAMYAVDPEPYLKAYRDAYVIAPAERAAFLADRGSLLVPEGLANKYGWKVGDSLPLLSNIFSNKTTNSHRWDFTIAGIIHTAHPDDPQGAILFHHAYFDETVTFGRDKFNWAVERIAPGADGDRIAGAIDLLFANSPSETATQQEKAFNRAFLAQIGNIALIVTLVVSAAFCTILMIVGNTMIMAIRERTKEIAVLKTLGFSRGRILRLVLGEALLLALLGGVPGLLLAVVVDKVALAKLLPGSTMTWPISLTGIGFMLAFGLVTGLAPALNAMRINIAAGLARF
ncbi:putative ABC transport system permease protein [Nitrospirillum amazonense]|uniref:Putative ABC transport system permease protein n=1 Tax=Nitrospirillum amazonense TaxID=28077 RepID=A0A560ESX4_9PROT|nr:ABC transporter permease [Nitrospirillum amazonense]TWB12417.1 putative ABC transport system permease protein [Nitrospirillum amazonense]